jgi:hypothetical protein
MPNILLAKKNPIKQGWFNKNIRNGLKENFQYFFPWK